MGHSGGDSAEFVLKKPSPRKGVPTRLKHLQNLIDDIKIKDTGRAGVHVHVNCQDLQMREVFQFLTMYLIFENMLVRWCGAGRVGNLFCLRIEDAPALLGTLRKVAKTKEYNEFGTDEHRYASVNVKALTTYGSLEFRAMRSTPDMKEIQKWVDILLKIKDESRKYNAPHEIVERLSFESTQGFFTNILGDTDVQYDHRDMMTGVRNAQYIAYADMDWPNDKDEEEEANIADLLADEEEAPRAHVNHLKAKAFNDPLNDPRPEQLAAAQKRAEENLGDLAARHRVRVEDLGWQDDNGGLVDLEEEEDWDED